LLRIEVNGEAVETNAATLAQLCDELGHGATKIATACNGTFVPAGARPETGLNSGDQIEILAPRQGG
jgi:sulfur carrier protein